jgi:hypothetical protein
MPRTASRPWRRALGSGLLVLLGLAAVLIPFEFLYVPRVLERATLDDRARFSPLMQVLSQSSKRSLVPERYVLLVGDSYAEGFGDWLESSDRSRNGAHHSAHVIHERLGRDVLSYGKGGVGSIPGLALVPARWDRALRRFGLAPPDHVVVYFYEGNDLNDDLRYLRRHHEGGADDPRLESPAHVDRFIRAEVDEYLFDKWLVDLALTPAYLEALLRVALVRLGFEEDAAAAGRRPQRRAHVNFARVGGRRVEIPDWLQGPALELTPAELERSLLVTQRSLAFLLERYAGVPVHLVRLPSPLSSYEMLGDQVSSQTSEGREPLQPTAKIEAHAAAIGAALAGFARERGIPFLDLLPDVRAATRERILHGPRDWRHFSREGYTLVGNAVAAHLRAWRPARAGPPPAAASRPRGLPLESAWDAAEGGL